MRIGIDLGGTKIEGIALAVDGRTLARRRVPTPRGDYGATIGAIVRLVRSLEDQAGEEGSVGVGLPGALSPATGLVKNANSTWLIGRPFDEDLAKALGREVRVENDANCFAVSEATDGAAAGAGVVFGVIVGTGCGGGVVVGGRPLRGRHAIAGEWGHNPLPWPLDDERPGPPCYCGKRGCIETFLSGPGVEADHRASTGEARALPAIAAAAAAGDRGCEDTLARLEDRMARALASVVNVIDPDVIVLGGGVSNLRRLYDNVPRLLTRYAFAAARGPGADAEGDDGVDVPVVPARFGDASGVRGAAWLWPR